MKIPGMSLKRRTTMCGNYFNLNAQINAEPPQPPVQGYHVHIYFEAGKESEKTALETVRKIEALFPDAVENVHRIGKAGPHTAPNFAVSISPESFGALIGWLQLNSKGLSILIHPETGDELKDHLESPLWLGKQLELNIAFFTGFAPPDKKGPARQ